MNKVIVSFDYNSSILDYDRDLIKKQLIQIQQKYKKFIDPVKFLVFDTNFTHRILHNKIRKQFEKDSVIDILKKWASKDISTGNKPGRIYTLDIPEKELMLDWDKPLSQQPKQVTDAISKIQGSTTGGWLNLNDGQSAYRAISRSLGGDVEASNALYTAGVRGINYPAGSLSNAKTEARNFVIFEPEDIKILAEDFLDQ